MQQKHVCRAWDLIRLLQLPHSKRICISSLHSLISLFKACICWILATNAAELFKAWKESDILRSGFILRECTKLPDDSILHIRSRSLYTEKLHDGHDIFLCCINNMPYCNSSGNCSRSILHFIMLYLWHFR